MPKTEPSQDRRTADRGTADRRTAPRTSRPGRRALYALFVFVVCVLLVDALVGDQGLVATLRARRQYTQLTAELARLRSENARFREDARRLREDPAAIEEIARRELGLMSPGETLFIIKDVIRKTLPPPPVK